MPNIPPTTPAELIAAMERFDRDHRGRGRFAAWPTLADKFALAYNGRYYPPKAIISMATSWPVSEFSGGAESTRYTDRYGFATVPIDATLREALRAGSQPPPGQMPLEEE